MPEPMLDLIMPFLGYLITADGAIHTAELAAIADLIEAGTLSAAARDDLARIFADADDKLPVATVIQHLAATDTSTQEQALVAAMVITYSDGFFDPNEAQLIEAFLVKTGFSRDRYLALREQAQQALQAEAAAHANPLTALLSATLRPLVSRLAAVSPAASRDYFAYLETRLLLAGPDYERAIERCAVVAREDFAFAAGYLQRGNERIKVLAQNITVLMRDIVQRPELQEIDVRATLTQLRGSINERLVVRVEQQRDSLVKRQRAMDSYTIAFVGRTKAGKSTLHAVITGEGTEAIGVGHQRTTRYNRVYVWKRLRLYIQQENERKVTVAQNTCATEFKELATALEGQFQAEFDSYRAEVYTSALDLIATRRAEAIRDQGQRSTLFVQLDACRTRLDTLLQSIYLP